MSERKATYAKSFRQMWRDLDLRKYCKLSGALTILIEIGLRP